MTNTAEPPAPLRAPTEVDALAERYLLADAALDPITATVIGLSGYDALLPDLSPDGIDARAELVRRTLHELTGVTPADDVDKVTVAALRERLTVSDELTELGVRLSELRNIASPMQMLRDVYELMPVDTEQDWANIASRMAGMPEAMDGYLDSLRLAASRGDVAPRRQVAACLDQCANLVGDDGFFASFTASALALGRPLPDTLRADLDRAGYAIRAAYQSLSDFLGAELLPQAPEADAVGRERYAVFSRQFLGSAVDLAETYAWGQQELAGISKQMAELADQLSPGASVAEAMAELDADPARSLRGTDALQRWMQDASDQAVAALADTHFDIPGPVRTLECRLARSNTGSIYYTGPSDDFSRPGRMWWSVPPGVTEFATWRERTTVYHEGVPGHHLQIAQTVYRRDLLNSWRRLGVWISGHGEGWALYAEQLMAELGFMDEPGNRLGMLDGQSLRAARVVIDIGVHCGFDAPDEVGGGAWTYDKAWTFLAAHCSMAAEFRRFELDRYLGWPGQAPSYKVGQRLWLQLRAESRARAGSAFDLKAFHRRALDIGSVGLDVLRSAVLDEL